MPRRNQAIIAFLVVVVSYAPAVGQMRGYSQKAAFDSNVQDVSLLQLIATPDRFDGKKVQFIGFLNIEFEGNAIYLHREDFDRAIPRNGVWINLPDNITKKQINDVNKQYVICVGVFRAGRHGHMGMFSGEITNVQRLELWPWSEHPQSETKPPTQQ